MADAITPDTEEGRDMTRTLSEIATGDRVVTGADWTEEEAPADDRHTDQAEPTATSVPATTTTARTVTADQWQPED